MKVNVDLMGKKCNSNQWCNNDKCQCDCKKCHACEKDYIWNSSTCSCKNGKYLASLIDNAVITCEEIIEEKTKTNFNEKKIQSVKQNVSIF